MTEMRDGDWFGADYFEYTPGETYKSNYARIQGGYKPEMARPEKFAVDIATHFYPRYLFSPYVDDTVLEIGCATGEAVLALRHLGFDAYGVDASEYILSRANELARPYLYCMDMRELLNGAYPEFLEEILDGRRQITAIVSKDVLEHVTEDLIDNILLAFSRLARHQYHLVNTGQHPHQAADGDQSHFLLRPLEWWREKAETLGINAIFEET